MKIIDGNTVFHKHNQKGGLLNERGAEIATAVFAGLFSAGTGGYYLWRTKDWTDFTNKWASLVPQNLRLLVFDTDEEDPSTTWYLGSWTEGTGGYSLWRTTDWNNFMSMFSQNKSTLRLLDFDIHPSGGLRYFTGTWGSTPIDQILVHDLSESDFRSLWDIRSRGGFRLVKIQVYQTATSYNLAGLFEAGGGSYDLQIDPDWNRFFQRYQTNKTTMQLVDFQVYDNDGTRIYIGVYRETSSAHQFIFNQDWGSFVNQWTSFSKQGLRLQKVVQYPNHVEVPEPQWDAVFQNGLGQAAEGFSYYILRHGQTIAKGVNHSRASQDGPQLTWTPDTRLNLASVSKSVTAVAVLKLLTDKHISIDDPFYPLVKSQIPTVGPGVSTITIRNLLQMKSGLTPDGTLFTPDIWSFLRTYLAAQNVPSSAPGNVSAYSNTNFTILQALIDVLTGHGGTNPSYYPTYVSDNVLPPMGINLSIFNPNPDPSSTAALSYSSGTDTLHGMYWPPINCIAAGGWISSARELIKFLAGVRNNVVLAPTTTQLMLNEDLGWYTYDGVYGQYFHHNGGLLNGLSPAQGLVTGIMHLSAGYDALLLVNSWGVPAVVDTIGLIVKAFETR